MNRQSPLRHNIFAPIFILFLSLAVAHVSSAQEFTAKHLGDYGNVTVMEVDGNYDAENADGTVRSTPREAIAREFFKTHKDEYDFLYIFTNFDFQMPEDGQVRAFYMGAKNDTHGIGYRIFSNSSIERYGSDNKLQGTIDMGNLSKIVSDPLDPLFEEGLYVLSHELMHRWGSFVNLKNPDGSDSKALLGKDGAHWSFLFDSGGSVLYGNRWQDNGNGTFTSLAHKAQLKYFGPLDLYLMGMLDKSKVPPMMLIENSSADPARMPEAGVTVTGTARMITIDEIIAANGPRDPDVFTSQKNFKTAFIFVTRPGTFLGDEIFGIENIRNGWVTRHSILTDGKSIVQVAATPKEDLPANPGILPPTLTPRAAESDIDDGVAWLMSIQNSDGSWSDLMQTAERDTAASTTVLKSFPAAQTNYQAGLGWLSNLVPTNEDYLCRKIEALGGNGQDVTLLIEELIGMRNTDNGWGSSRTYRSNAADTALSLKALSAAGYADLAVLSTAIQYLKSAQKPDGGWTGNGESTIQATSNALSALIKYQASYQLDETIAKAIAWLLTKQNSDGGFGNSPSTVYDTAVATLALREFDVDTTITNKALDYLKSQQDQNGSWNQSAYQTALAVAAILKGTVDPDLVVKTSDISFIPERISSLPSNIVISANISNLGRTAVQQAKVALYEGDPALGNKLSEQTLAFPGNSATFVTFQLEVADGTERRLYMVVDQENLIKESNESNNSAFKILSPIATYDFVIEAADISVTPNPVDQYQDVTITAKITNKGTMNAYNVQVKYFIDEQTPFEIATLTVDIPSGETITKTATWRASKAGVNMPLAVQADPFNNFTEISETNNKVSVSMTVNQVILTDPNITISYRDMTITPSTANQGGNAAISAVVKNEGFSAANNITVNFYRGVAGPNGLLLGSRTISSLGVNESTTVSMDWTNIQETGEKIIYVEADYAGQEIQKDDNAAFLTLNVLSYPDLVLTTDSISVMPALPREGDPTTIYVKVRNQGDQSVSNVPVVLSDDNTEIGTQSIASLSGNNHAILTFTYDTNGKIGMHTLTAVVDKANEFIEQSESNNSATRTFGVNDASQWVTEEYFSPNGDGVKDTTEVFFRLATAETVSINIVNEKGETVRAFSGAEFANTTGGSIIWDGLNDSGRVVDDGRYQVAVKGSNGAQLKSVSVVVDNNRSSFFDALNAGKLMDIDLSCAIPQDQQPYFNSKHIWLPDGSGALYYYPYGQGSGFYVTSIDGKDNRPLTLSALETRGSVEAYEVAPDGQTFAIITSTGSVTELWLADIDGVNIRLLDSYDGAQAPGYSLYGQMGDEQNDGSGLKWSPDGKYIAYPVSWIKNDCTNASDCGSNVTGLNIETGTKITLFTANYNWFPGSLSYRWSPDGNKLVVLSQNWYSYYCWSGCWPHRDVIGLAYSSDIWTVNKDSFNKTILLDNVAGLEPQSYYGYSTEYEWLNDSLLLFLDRSHDIPGTSGNRQLRLVSTTDFERIYDVWGPGIVEPVIINEDPLPPGDKIPNYKLRARNEILATEVYDFTVSPIRKNIAYVAGVQYDTISLFDINTRTSRVLRDDPQHYFWWLQFSPDESQLAYMQYDDSKGDWDQLSITNLGDGTYKKVNSDVFGSNFNGAGYQGYAWLADSRRLVIHVEKTATGENFYQNLIYVVDSVKEEATYLTKGTLFENSIIWWNTVKPITPDLPAYKNKLVYTLPWYDGGCGGWSQSSSFKVLTSAADLTVDLYAVKNSAQIDLRGIASDLNFEGYKIDFASLNNPDSWQAIVPFSEKQVINDIFTSWVPPLPGTYNVKLTAWDKAGNTASTKKKVSWGKSSSITNFYKNNDFISPKNQDGLKDSIVLRYRVLEPMHLEFSIVDEQNNVVATIQKDYLDPADGFISWDGQDMNGQYAPDGRYKIKALNYEFFVTVDNSVPDVAIALDFTLVIAELSGHVIDNNLKKWTIEYGEGDNPEEWIKYDEGSENLINKSDPNEEAIIRQFIKVSDVAWLKGKKLRLTAEDYADNRRTVITNYMREGLTIREWDNYPSIEKIPSYLLTGNIHNIAVLETIAVPLASVTLQYMYWPEWDWRDGITISNPPAGAIGFKWDISGIDLFNRIRVLATDVLGRVHASQEVYVGDDFYIRTCSLKAVNSVAENLQSLTFSIKSDQDSNYLQDTKYFVYDTALGHSIPTGQFAITIPALSSGMTYTLKMTGVGLSGKEYKSEIPYPSCPFKLYLLVDPQIAKCGEISNKAILTAQIDPETISKKSIFTVDQSTMAALKIETLTYSVLEAGVSTVIRQIDVATEGLASVTIDTSHMKEGSHQVKAAVTYMLWDKLLNSYVRDTMTSIESMTVDRRLPAATIMYPQNASTICPTPIGNNRSGIVVNAVVDDNVKVDRYGVVYGVGLNPADWNNTGIWQEMGGTAYGNIGTWNTTEQHDESYSLKLMVTDAAGNTSCTTTGFSFDGAVSITNASTDTNIFSPNIDGTLDEVHASYTLNEAGEVNVKVHKVLNGPDGNLIFDPVPIRNFSALQHPGGTGQIAWDGNNDGGQVVSDGIYEIAISVKDSCGNTVQKSVSVVSDTTKPTTVITFPTAGNSIGNIVEVRGSAEDKNFQTYRLEAGQGEDPDTWTVIKSSATTVKDGVLGTWNTYDLAGKWTLRLTASDRAGNSNETQVTIDLGTRQKLIKALDVLPKLISPNDDGKMESAVISYETTALTDIKLEVVDSGGNVKRTMTSAAVLAGIHSYNWNGRDEGNTVVIDGEYSLKLTASLTSDTSVIQVESISMVVDSTRPSIAIAQPADNSYVKTAVTINGSIADPNIAEYSVSYEGSTGPVLVDNGAQARSNYTFGTLSDLAEGNYTLRITAKDQAENTENKTSTFTVDRTPPAVKLDAPKDGDFYGAGKDTITVSGSIIENNLDFYSVRYGAGENPSQWTELSRGTSLPTSSQLCTWNVGTNSGIAEGTYTLSLYAKDKAGSEADVRIHVAVDSQPPVMRISEPVEGQYIKAATQVKGTASDQNLEKYTLEISEGNCSDAFKWMVIKTGTVSITTGVIAEWQTMPPDGNYCLKATAYDKIGNKTAATVNVKVDTHPPVPPVLAGKVENITGARLDWLACPESDITGYNVYKNNQKLNSVIVTDVTYLDQNLSEGSYSYQAKALDAAGWESESSNEVKIKIDTTAPTARIRTPLNSSSASGTLDIKGTAYSVDDFKQYRVFVGQGASPSSWTLLRTSSLPVSYGLLTQWDSFGLPEGEYSIKLEAEDISGNINTHQITIALDNTPPQKPVIDTATRSGSSATVVWNQNTESDLAGYLLYRNDQIANASGMVLGDVKSYLISELSYLDSSLPDGRFSYYLVAADNAGNMSERSDSREVTVETRAPQTAIVSPSDTSIFEGALLLKAESSDLDIASVQFQYKKATDSSWNDLNLPQTTQPYVTYLDPSTGGLNLAYGFYNLRAVATDVSGNKDSSPASITVTYTDLKTPLNLVSRVNGTNVTLTWNANGEGYLSGYNAYRTSGGTRSKMNSALNSGVIYEDQGVADGTYTYDITAVDKANNESSPTKPSPAVVYAPVITQPTALSTEPTVQINGNSAAANALVEVFVQDNSGTHSAGAAQADGEGKFGLPVSLSPGENRITAKATDGSGNVSKISQAVLVIYNEAPGAPSGLAAEVADHNVHLTWNKNSESDVAGYKLYRDGAKLNTSESIISGTATASSTYYSYYAASKAFDRDPGTIWLSDYSYEMNPPIWWQIAFTSAELINGMEIQWYEYYIGKNFEIQAGMGDSWVTLKKITGNTVKDNTIDLGQPVRTDKIRIYITDVNIDGSYKYAGISEVRILKDKLIADQSYDDLNLHDGKYEYRLTAVDYYGLESVPAEPLHVEVGDVVPPAAPQNFTAAATGSSIALDWSTSETDVAGFNLYKKTGQEWTKINTALVTVNSYIDASLPNGTYFYRVTAVDLVGNESVPSEEQATINVFRPSHR